MKEIEKVVHEGKAAQPRKVRIQLERSKLGTCVYSASTHLQSNNPYNLLNFNDIIISLIYFFFFVIQEFPFTWIILLGPVRQRSTSSGRVVPGLGTRSNTQYRIW